MISAIDFGIKYRSCQEAMEWRRGLPAGATQADAWQACHRCDWMIWQYSRLPSGMLEQYRPALRRAIDRIVARAIRRGVKSIRGVRAEWATKYRRWARRWLSGEDRSAEAAVEAAEEEAEEAAEVAWAAVWAAVDAVDAAEAAELRLQARDIRREIPDWPGE
jgi:hypothetical protein